MITFFSLVISYASKINKRRFSYSTNKENVAQLDTNSDKAKWQEVQEKIGKKLGQFLLNIWLGLV